MPSKVEALGILLLLLPGFLCSFLVRLISVRAKQTEFDKVVEALLFSTVLYLGVGWAFGNTLPISWVEQKKNGGPVFTFLLNFRYLLWLSAGSVLCAFAYGATVNHDWFHRLLRTVRLTEKTSRLSVTTRFKTYKAGTSSSSWATSEEFLATCATTPTMSRKHPSFLRMLPGSTRTETSSPSKVRAYF